MTLSASTNVVCATDIFEKIADVSPPETCRNRRGPWRERAPHSSECHTWGVLSRALTGLSLLHEAWTRQLPGFPPNQRLHEILDLFWFWESLRSRQGKQSDQKQ